MHLLEKALLSVSYQCLSTSGNIVSKTLCCISMFAHLAKHCFRNIVSETLCFLSMFACLPNNKSTDTLIAQFIIFPCSFISTDTYTDKYFIRAIASNTSRLVAANVSHKNVSQFAHTGKHDKTLVHTGKHDKTLMGNNVSHKNVS